MAPLAKYWGPGQPRPPGSTPLRKSMFEIGWMWRGKEFHTLGAETRKARTPNKRLCCGTESKWLALAGERVNRADLWYRKRSVRYGLWPVLRTLKTKEVIGSQWSCLWSAVDVSGEREDRLLHDSDFTGRLDNDGLTMLGLFQRRSTDRDTMKTRWRHEYYTEYKSSTTAIYSKNCGPAICLKCDQINRKSAHGIIALTTKNKVLRYLATKL